MRILYGAFPEMSGHFHNHLAACGLKLLPILMALCTRAHQQALDEDSIRITGTLGDTSSYGKPECVTLKEHSGHDAVGEISELLDPTKVSSNAGVSAGCFSIARYVPTGLRGTSRRGE